MHRSTRGAFTGIESHTPRVCEHGPNSSFRTNSDESLDQPPPIPCRPLPPPLPPKHRLRKVTEVEINKNRKPLKSVDAYTKDVYESISDSQISTRPHRNSVVSRSYALRDFPLCPERNLGVGASSPHTIQLGCANQNVSNHTSQIDSRAIKQPHSTPFPIDQSSDRLRSPCTCGLSKNGTQPSISNNQSPVWSKMPLAASRPVDSTRSWTSFGLTSANSHERSNVNHKCVNVNNHSWTISRISRTMSRIFRRKVSNHKSKEESLRSQSVYFSGFNECPINNMQPSPFTTPGIKNLNTPVTAIETLPPPAPLPLPPSGTIRSRPLTDETATATLPSLLCCRDQQPAASDVTNLVVGSTSVQRLFSPSVTCTTNKPRASFCVHHVHHIHHVHHHLHHVPPPTMPATSQTATSLTTSSGPGNDASTLVMVLENAATLGDTPPPSLPQTVSLKDFKSLDQSVGTVGGTHTYSAYGVRDCDDSGGRGGSTRASTCCPMSTTPSALSPNNLSTPNATTTTSLRRQSTTVCSNPHCIAAHCHVQSNPLRTPTSVELTEFAEVGAEAVFGSSGNEVSQGPPSPAAGLAASSAATPSPNSPLSQSARLMHHMHHHHMHHMLHHIQPPSVSNHSNNAPTPISSQRDSAASAVPSRCPTVDSGVITSPETSAVRTCVDTLSTFQDHRPSFQEGMKALKKMGWYWGPLSFTEADKLLANRPDGTFLVRDSAHDTFFLSLSFRVRGTTYHTRIEHNQGRFSFWFEPVSLSASTVVEFIERAVAHSNGGKYHYFLQTSTPGQQPVEVSLLYPLSRFQVVQSLSHLARFTVLSHVRRDHVTRLPLPPRQIDYLLEKQVYWESLEGFVEAIRDHPPLQFTSAHIGPSKP